MLNDLFAAPVNPAIATNAAPLEDVQRLFAAQQARRWAVAQTSAAERITKLQRLKAAMQAHRAALCAAMQADFGRHPTESDLLEIQPTIAEIKYAIKHLRRWMQPQRVATPLLLTGTRSQIRHEPKGVVLILAPWNYPLLLLFAPLVGAIAAGNCAIVWPSEKVPHTAAVMGAIIKAAFAPHEIALLTGDVATAEMLITLPFDHIFFTGSTPVGRKVMAAAAHHLTPVTLELGGKSPVIIDETADLAAAAQRVAWGKYINAGQTCVAPDYVLAPEHRADAFVRALNAAIARLYGATAAARTSSDSFARLIDERAFERLTRWLDESVAAGAQVAVGGERDRAERYLAPTVLTNVTPDMPIMAEEIFGPILPVLRYRTLDEAIAFVNARPKPLALYLFSAQPAIHEHVLRNTTAGGTVINNVVIHLGNPALPFGGVGGSGQGNYHGWYGFRTFSHERAVLRQTRFFVHALLYPPYSKRVQRLIKALGRALG